MIWLDGCICRCVENFVQGVIVRKVSFIYYTEQFTKVSHFCECA